MLHDSCAQTKSIDREFAHAYKNLRLLPYHLHHAARRRRAQDRRGGALLVVLLAALPRDEGDAEGVDEEGARVADDGVQRQPHVAVGGEPLLGDLRRADQRVPALADAPGLERLEREGERRAARAAATTGSSKWLGTCVRLLSLGP